MNAAPLKSSVYARIWREADRHGFVTSATLTGSFVDSPGLEGVSDIDLVLTVDRLDGRRFAALNEGFDAALRPVLAAAGYDFRVNPTLGPLKFNGPNLAVLHLMVYTDDGHAEHVVNSPFTCLDWQRSGVFRKRRLADVYPVFGLMPRHFLPARRGAKDYLKDFRDGVVSYRELVCDDVGHREEKRGKPMGCRDRHEFAYHVLKFLMQNLLKLVRRENVALPAAELPGAYFALFPDGAAEFGPLFRELARRKQAMDFADPVPDLGERLQAFVDAFQRQFEAEFVDAAGTHVAVRHLPTGLNAGEARFQGRVDPDILPATPAGLDGFTPAEVYTSPARRCRQTLAAFGLDAGAAADGRLAEQDYGAADGLTISEARERFPALFEAWSRGEDPPFPGGESQAEVAARAAAFAAERWVAGRATLTCTHNVVLRCLIGSALGVPAAQWHRLRVPHGEPLRFVSTPRFGLFADVGEAAERHLFAGYRPGPNPGE